MQKGKFVQSTECIDKWPRTVQMFLESKIQEVNEADHPSIGKRMSMSTQFYEQHIYMVHI